MIHDYGRERKNKELCGAESKEFKPVKYLKFLEKEVEGRPLDETDSFLLRVPVFFHMPYSKNERNAQDSYSY